jgi:hypothetical protein
MPEASLTRLGKEKKNTYFTQISVPNTANLQQKYREQ